MTAAEEEDEEEEERNYCKHSLSFCGTKNYKLYSFTYTHDVYYVHTASSVVS